MDKKVNANGDNLKESSIIAILVIVHEKHKNHQRNGYQHKAGQSLIVRPELVEGGMVKPLMVRQAHHERINHRTVHEKHKNHQRK